jgi:CRP-like cAMP-binding protein
MRGGLDPARNPTMTHPAHGSVRNRLLTRLPAETFARLQPHMRVEQLPLKHVLVEPYADTNEVCFIELGLGSMIALTDDGERVEVGHIGPEGMTGTHVFLGTRKTPNQTFMQVEGHGIMLPVDRLLEAATDDPAIREFFLRYAHTCDIQLAQSALANARYSMSERLARWLLMCHDRMDGNDLPLTHEFLALMLGVRRSGVTGEIHVLEGMQLIKATRGNVRILDRARLEGIAGGCYGVAEREYERLLGLPLKRPVAA